MAFGLISAGLGLASSFLGNRSAKKAAGQSLMGFNYLKDNALVNQAQSAGSTAGGLVSALLGLGGDEAAAEEAFSNYRDSTGYQFRMNEGLGAIEGSAAAKGLLNSGATARALTRFGQDFASSEFTNYVNMMRDVQGTGLNAAFNVASQGTSGGGTAAQYTQQGYKDVGTGLAAAAGGITDFIKQGGFKFG